MAADLVKVVGQTTSVPVPVPVSGPVDFGFGDVVWALVWIVILALPLMLTVGCMLDAARRPRWAWAFAERSQVVWIALLLFSTLTVVGGIAAGAWYLTRVRPAVAAVERGELGGLP